MRFLWCCCRCVACRVFRLPYPTLVPPSGGKTFCVPTEKIFSLDGELFSSGRMVCRWRSWNGMDAEKSLHASLCSVVLIAVKVSAGVQGKGFGDVFKV